MPSSEEQQIFSRRLRELRKEREWTQSKLARQANLTPSAISQFEGGEREPRFDSIIKLAHALEVSPSYLAGLEEYETTDQETRQLLRDVKGLSREDRKRLSLYASMLRQEGEQESGDDE